MQVHSVDAVAKKIGFQLQSEGSAQVAPTFYPTHRRVEALTLVRTAFDLIVSRAYAVAGRRCSRPSSILLERRPRRVLAMKGGASPPQRSMRVSVDVAVSPMSSHSMYPFLGAQRCAVLILQRLLTTCDP